MNRKYREELQELKSKPTEQQQSNVELEKNEN